MVTALQVRQSRPGQKTNRSLGFFFLVGGGLMEESHRLILVLRNSMSAPMKFAQPIERAFVPSLGGPFEPLKSVCPIANTEGHVAKAEHGAGLAPSRGFAIPVPGFLSIARNAYPTQIKPAHRQNRVGVAFLRRFCIKQKGADFIFGRALTFKASKRLIVKLILILR